VRPPDRSRFVNEGEALPCRRWLFRPAALALGKSRVVRQTSAELTHSGNEAGLHALGRLNVSVGRRAGRMKFVTCFLLATLGAVGQTGARVRFDAASIKPSGPDSRAHLAITPGRLSATKIDLRRAIFIAYHLMPYDVWADPRGWNPTASISTRRSMRRM
jgi:hypothetical protein